MKNKMELEAIESSAACLKQYQENQDAFILLGEKLRQIDPYNFVTSARGSSDHAASFLNFLTMQHMGIFSTSLPMSLVTLYQTQLNVKKAVCVGISQSGQSPDVRAPIQYFQKNNSLTIGLVNEVDSPLAHEVETMIPLFAGKENAVAATKSFITSLAASYSLIAHWKNDPNLIKEIPKIPFYLEKAQTKNWSKLTDALINEDKLMVVGRGPGLSLALEASLKFKETCQIQAEAFSSAEIKHGPQALVDKNYTILIFANSGPIMPDLLKLSQEYKAKGAKVILAAPSYVKEKDLEIESCAQPELEILTAIQSFYLEISKLSSARGLNPDAPANLSKVTTTT